jgi:hypothetical protein
MANKPRRGRNKFLVGMLLRHVLNKAGIWHGVRAQQVFGRHVVAPFQGKKT